MNTEIENAGADRAGILENIIQNKLIYAEDEDFLCRDGRLTLSDVTIAEDVREHREVAATLKERVEKVLSLYYDAENREELRFTLKEESALWDFLPARNPSGMALVALFTKKILSLKRSPEPVLTVAGCFIEDVEESGQVLKNLCAFLLTPEEQKQVILERSDEPVVRTQVLKPGLSVTTAYHFEFEEELKTGGDLSPEVLRALSETEREKRIRSVREAVLADISGLIHDIEQQREGSNG